MSPGQDLHQGLFFFAFPDLCHHRVTPTPPQRVDPEVAVDQDKGVDPLPQNNHRKNLPKTLDETGQDQYPLRPVDPAIGIAKIQMSNLDLFHFSEMSRLHEYLSLDGEIDLPPNPYIHKNDTTCFCQTMPWHEP